jgi:type II secretory pathway pseudopilin PulG
MGKEVTQRAIEGGGRSCCYAPLLELVVVVVIIGLFAGLVSPPYFGQIGKSEITLRRRRSRRSRRRSTSIASITGHYPSTELGLYALVSARRMSRRGIPIFARTCRSSPGASPI